MNFKAAVEALGGMPTKVPVAKSITFNGHTEDFYFRELAAGRLTSVINTNDVNELLAATVTNEDGTEKVDKAEFKRIKHELRTLLRKAALEVNHVAEIGASKSSDNDEDDEDGAESGEPKKDKTKEDDSGN